MSRPLIAACLVAGYCIAGHAACDTGLAERMNAQLHPQRALNHDLALCTPWRGVLGRFIVLLPLVRPPSQPDSTDFDLEVLVVQQADNGNTEHARVVSRLFERAALTEDALRISEIKIDTARYMLARDARAFGVRVVYQGSSRANPYSNETLNLYVPQGAKLTKVLDRLEIDVARGEWDTTCAGNFETVRGTLTVAVTTSNGYADMALRRTRSQNRSIVQGDQCLSQDLPSTVTTTTLRFDGMRYVADKATTTD